MTFRKLRCQHLNFLNALKKRKEKKEIFQTFIVKVR